jgi:hypothetical protein
MIQRFPSGIDDDVLSVVTKTGSRMGCGLGRGWQWQGYPGIPPKNIRDIEEITSAKKILS